MTEPEYVVIDLVEMEDVVTRRLAYGPARRSDLTPRTIASDVLAVLREHGVPAREESSRYYEASGPRHTRLVTDWREDPA